MLRAEASACNDRYVADLQGWELVAVEIDVIDEEAQGNAEASCTHHLFLRDQRVVLEAVSMVRPRVALQDLFGGSEHAVDRPFGPVRERQSGSRRGGTSRTGPRTGSAS